jgi:hypothetical protein
MKDKTYYCVVLKTANVTIYCGINALEAQKVADAHHECMLVEK